MDANSNAKTKNGDNKPTQETIRKYDREEMFRLAKLMPNTEQEVKDIERYESLPCSKLKLGSIPNAAPAVDEDDRHLKFILRRQHSDLNFTSLNHDRRGNSWRNSDRQHLSSMASNFNSLKPEVGGRESGHLNKIDSRIPKAEHGPTSGNYNRRGQLIRSTSNMTNWNRSQSFYEQTGRYRAVDKSREHADIKHSPINYRHTEEEDFTPVQRFGLVERTNGEGAVDLKSIEDDDFDATKLLSITVLSDIKTIRQDPQLNNARRNNSRLPTRTQNDPPPRPFTRSQTSTDFTYNGRRLNSEYNRFKQNQRFHQQPLTHYDASPDLYAFQQPKSIFHGHIPMFDNQIKPVKQITKPPLEERDVSIIESFRAQVRARAMDPNLKPIKLTPTSTNKISNSSPKKPEKPTFPELNISTKLSLDDEKKQPEVDSIQLAHALSTQTDETMSLPVLPLASLPPKPRKSQIPRLMALHKSKLSTDALLKTDSKVEETKEVKSDTTSKLQLKK